jgi:hypothetical protein
MADASVQRSSKIFTCENCNYSTSRDSQYKRHLSTLKHKETDERLTNASANALPNIEYTCDCGKSYSHRQSLHKHKQKCKKTPEPEETPQPAVDKATVLATDKLFTLVTELMLQLAAKDKQQEELIQQNKELQNTMKEMIPHLGNNNNVNSNNNTTFNVQLYLENECKDALSIQEFVKRIEISMDHLRTIAKDGYVDSVSNILIKALNNMAITERPLHCTDLKRETVYIKNNETWNKSTADEPLMNGLINTIENKHYAVVKHYVQTTPAARELDTPEYNFYAKACVHALGNYEDHDKLNKKIYKKVLPEIKLDKSVI